MTVLYVGVAVLLTLALVIIVWPLISGRKATVDTLSADSHMREATNRVLYQDHLKDLQLSLSTGNITQEQYDELTAELDKNLIEDSVQSSSQSISEKTMRMNNASKRPAIFLVALFAILLVMVFIIYSKLGSYNALGVQASLEQRNVLEEQYINSADAKEQLILEARLTESNQQLIAQLQTTINRDPDDVQMRALLARTAMGMADYDLAIAQFQGILVVEPEVSQIMAELAQALFLKANNRVTPMVQSFVDATLEREPNNTIALGLAGIGAYQSEQYAKAIELWQKAIVIQGANSPNSIALERGIVAAQQRLGVNAVEDATESANEVVNDENEPRITVSVSLSSDIDVPPTTTVFIYARAWQSAKVPLSIARLQVSDLPVTLTLTNAMSMAPSMNLSTAESIELVARVSASGTPVPQSGDWQITQGPIEVNDLVSESSENSSANTVSPIVYSLLISQQIP